LLGVTFGLGPLALWHAWRGFEEQSGESTFVYRVALNTALAGRRRSLPGPFGATSE
jgi:hypothetical protein